MESLHFTSSNRLLEDLEELAEHSPSFEPRRRLFLCKDSPPTWRQGDFLGFKIPSTVDNLQYEIKAGGPPNTTSQKMPFYIATPFPTCSVSWCLKPSELQDMQELIIAWVIYQRSAKSISSSSGPSNSLSTLGCSTIPEDGARFFMQSSDVLESRWTRVLKEAENHMRKQRRMGFDKTPGGSASLDTLKDLRLSMNIIEKL